MSLSDLYTQLEIFGLFLGVFATVLIFFYQTRAQTKTALDKANREKADALDKVNEAREKAFREVNEHVEEEFKEAGLERQDIRTRLTVLETMMSGMNVKSSVEWDSYKKRFPILLKHAHTPVKDALIDKFSADTITIDEVEQLDAVCVEELREENLSMSDAKVVVEMMVMLAVRKAEASGPHPSRHRKDTRRPLNL